MKEIQKFVFVTMLLTLIVHQKAVTKAEYLTSEENKIELNFFISKTKYGQYKITPKLNRKNSKLPKSLDIRTKNVIVQDNTLILPVILSESSKYRAPPAGYDTFTNMGYKFHYKFYAYYETSFKIAKAVCERDNAHLAIINSRQEAEILKMMYGSTRAKQYAWVGFHDMNYEGKYFTVLGEPIEETGYVHWAYRQPDNPGFEKCGAIDRNGYFNNMVCESRYPFFCEYEEHQVTFS